MLVHKSDLGEQKEKGTDASATVQAYAS